MAQPLSTPIEKAFRTTKEFLQALEEMEIQTVEDLLLYLPRGHEDLSSVQTLASAQLDTKVTVRGTIDKVKLVRTRSRKQLVTGVFLDAEGTRAEVVWFNQPHIKRMLSDGQEVVLTGKLVENGYKLQFQSPQFEHSDRPQLIHGGRLVPIYPQHGPITARWLREKIAALKDSIALLPETLPKEVLEDEHLMPRAEAVRALHFPDKAEDVQRALDRMAFEQLYQMQADALALKQEWQGERQERLMMPMDVELIRALFASLKFTPTGSQKIAIYEILKDMEKDQPMSRLLEGDVGSGKTLVATAAMAHVIRHGGQCALMVPTEVLAKQHAESIGKVLIQFAKTVRSDQPFNLSQGKWVVGSDQKIVDTDHLPLTTHHLPSIALLTGSTPTSEAKRIKQGIATGTIDLVIGTHALIEDSVQFHDLKLVIVDEQHRFGVAQRARLRDKGSPHFLAMTATPIPRTLALTAYGHHDLSVLLEKPGNRKPITTKVVAPRDRVTVERFIDHQIDEGRQVFVICPLITGSENEEMLDIRSVESEAARLKEAFPRRSIAVLHGRMTPPEKEATMRAFKEKKYDILVSTSVIEVGIDVPNATIILIEGAERFGLSQLHQFRGRVGRSDHQSHCFLFPTNPEQARSQRLKAMEKYDSGFLLAEIDLKLRGPGELFGLRQSGIPESKLAAFMHPEMVVRARRAAEKAMASATS